MGGLVCASHRQKSEGAARFRAGIKFPSLLFLILTIAQYLIRYPENPNNDIVDWSRNEIKRGYNVNENNDENNDSHGTSSVIMNRFF